MYSVLADLIVFAHLAYFLFVVLGQAAILLGWALKWRWVRNPVFRYVHLAAIVVVALEAVADVQCPLTVWERGLRAAAGETVSDASFVGRLANRLLFFELPHWIFRVAHISFGVLVLATFILAPPRRSACRPESS